MLFIFQNGYEDRGQAELAARLGSGEATSPPFPLTKGPGWLWRADHAPSSSPIGAGSPPVPDLAFPHLILFRPAALTAPSVNALAAAILDWFLSAVRGDAIADPWPSWWAGPAELTGLGRRVSAVEAAFGELLRKRMSRVARLATSAPAALPPLGPARGLFVWFTDFQRAWVARTAWRNGQRRMADDPAAPSRSYLKVEEAYGLLGREPAPGERVVDLGAAPGGWSYSAAKRGARVVAVDNGPLKAGAAAHPSIEHLRADAFAFTPPADSGPVDWLFCDLVEEPHHVLSHLLRPWCDRRWCRRFIVNLKFGRVNPITLLNELRAPGAVPASTLRIRHLYHDREEFTLVGEP